MSFHESSRSSTRETAMYRIPLHCASSRVFASTYGLPDRALQPIVRREGEKNMKRFLIAVIAALMSANMLWATPPSGQTSTVIGPPAIMDPLKVGRQTNAWQIEIE